MRKKIHDIILGGEHKKQHQSTVFKSYSNKYPIVRERGHAT